MGSSLDNHQPRPWPGHQSPQEPKASVAPSDGARARAAAARVVQAVMGRGRSLTEALEQLEALDQERDRPLVQELSYGALRLLPRLRAIAAQLLSKPLKPEDGDLEALILIGLYQLLATRIPPHAAVASSVAATRVLGKGWAAKLVNALLRRFQREREVLLAQADKSEEARWLFPAWLLDRLRTAWPQDWREIVAASNTQAPLWLRVNRRAGDRDAYLKQLAAAGIA
ncbi:MAG: 16S rRNA (cytosine(967)-C(5))-methyltransferase RsmB, partial [Chromatiaceae bacterium]|nr:16S rRNA (cytosine(967)-C(5))-methyltransferase RsmB [Chromatiaceae bacterium]